jgi:hypothetical protein
MLRAAGHREVVTTVRSDLGHLARARWRAPVALFDAGGCPVAEITFRACADSAAVGTEPRRTFSCQGALAMGTIAPSPAQVVSFAYSS